MSSLKALSSLLFCGRSASPLFTTSESTAGLRHRPISQEEILPSRNSRKKPVRAHPGGVLVAPVTGKPGVRFSPPPSTPPAATLRRNQARYQNKSQLEGESDVESTDSEASSFGEDTENDSEEAKIPKPEGEAGRPGRGGYNLENVVQWNSTEFRRLKKKEHKLISEHLDEAKPFSQQPLALIDVVKRTALNNFPLLNEFQGLWPVDDFIRLRLKYTCSRSKRQLEKLAAGKKMK